MTDTSSLTTHQQQIIQILHTESSFAHPMLISVLSKRIHKSAGQTHGLINSLRIKSFPICSNKRGYFYAKTNDELRTYITQTEEKIFSHVKMLEGLKNAYGNIDELVLMRGAMPSMTIKKQVYLRNPDGTVRSYEAVIDGQGHPVIPEGTTLV